MEVENISSAFFDGQKNGGDSLPTVQSPPPGNNNCSAGLGALYTLFPGAACTNGSLNGSNPSPAATVEVGETFDCMAGPPTRTVWYNFTATAANMWVCIEPTGTLVCGQTFGLRVYSYTGACPPPTGNAVGCKAYIAYSAQNVFNILNLTGLTIGNTYMIQVGQNPACGRYDFCIRIGVPSTCNTCGNVCGPLCTYAGPTAPTPTQITSSCTGYPLSPPMNQFDSQTNCFTFTAPNDSISLQQIVNSYCSPNTYSFTYNLYNSSCGLIQSGNVFTNNNITGLTPGVNYRICYSLQAACSWTGLMYPYVYTTSTVLPVELLYFDAYNAGGKIELYWSTASEINSYEFIVERTVDAQNFEEVARLRAAGNSSTTISYKAVDAKPVTGTAYYRLRQVDIDGTTYDSKLIAVKHLPACSDAHLFPNPAGDQSMLRLTATETAMGRLAIADALGRPVSEYEISLEKGLNFIPVDLTKLSKGIYSVRLFINEESTSLKLVRN
jgi:hypothetical protein